MAVHPTALGNLSDIRQGDEDFSGVVGNVESSSVYSNPLEPDTSPPDEGGSEERGEQKEPLHICLRGPTVGAVPRSWEEKETDCGDRETPDPHDRE
jgi:hypothetical protein